jgi:hypothetical protein
MSQLGQTRRFDSLPATSGLPPTANIVGSDVADPDYSGRPEARIASIRGVASSGTQPMAEH